MRDLRDYPPTDRHQAHAPIPTRDQLDKYLLRWFFEALAADNLDIGRPDNMEIIFNRQIRSVTKGVFRTAVDRDNDGVVVNACYRHSRIKTYLNYLQP